MVHRPPSPPPPSSNCLNGRGTSRGTPVAKVQRETDLCTTPAQHTIPYTLAYEGNRADGQMGGCGELGGPAGGQTAFKYLAPRRHRGRPRGHGRPGGTVPEHRSMSGVLGGEVHRTPLDQRCSERLIERCWEHPLYRTPLDERCSGSWGSGRTGCWLRSACRLHPPRWRVTPLLNPISFRN